MAPQERRKDPDRIAAKVLTVRVDFKPGTRFTISGPDGAHPVHDIVARTRQHPNFVRRQCHLQLRTPRVKPPGGSVRLVEPDFARSPSGFTLPFEALMLMLAQQMPFTAVARIVAESAHRETVVCERAHDVDTVANAAVEQHGNATVGRFDDRSQHGDEAGTPSTCRPMCFETFMR